MTKRILKAIFIISIFLFMLCSCAGTADIIGAESVIVDVHEYVFTNKQQTLCLNAVVYPVNADDKSITWISSDTSVVTVDDDGKVSPVSNGEAVITAITANGAGVCRSFMKVELPFEVYPVEGIMLSESYLTMKDKGETYALEYTIWPENATNKTVMWSSSDTDVATVDENGVVTVHNPGYADIVVTTDDGGFFAVCELTSEIDIPLKDVNFNRSSFTFRDSEDELVLIPEWTPFDTTQKGLIWKTSNASVATVDEITGVVTPHSNGTATITATSVANSRYKASCKVKVNFIIPVSGMELPFNELELNDDLKEYTIKPSVLPSNASNKSIIYTSSDDCVAEVSYDGTIRGLSNGVAVITATTADGGFSDAILVTVNMTPHPEIVKFSTYSHTFAAKGEKIKVSVTILPADAKDKSYTLKSADESIATVSQDGTITCVGYGTTFISAKANDGGVSDTLFVTCFKPNSNTGESGTTIIREGKLKGVWVATISSMDFPSKTGASAEKLKAELNEIVATCEAAGLNAIFFQVRPASDAFYESDIFPTSRYLTGKQGNPLTLDCLEYLISIAHPKNIEVHAWINPYRIGYGHDITLLAESNPARKNPDWVVYFKDSGGQKTMWYNPGIPEVRQLIVDGVVEIIKNYDVDGIHFDDYFYPYDTNSMGFDDADAFKKYNTADLSLADWRRNNNDSLILAVHNAIMETDRSVVFGVAPFGVWAKKSHTQYGTDVPGSNESYYSIYADTRKWVLNGWLDYICPQIYWETDRTAAPFRPIVDWWDELVKTTDVDLFVGMQIEATQHMSTQPNKSFEELTLEAEYISGKKYVNGAVYFSYTDIKKNISNCTEITKKLFKE